MDLTETESSGIPIRLGAAPDFETVASFCRDAGYTEAGLNQRLSHPSIYHFRSLADGRTAGTTLDSALDLLIRLFMDQDGIPLDLVERFVPRSALDAFGRLGLVYQSGSAIHGTVLCYPTEGFLVVSDRTVGGPGSELGDDVVYPAITDHCGNFLRFLPRTGCGTFLEACGGTGIAAMAASRFASRSWTIDITLRAAWFAEFNRRLNRLANLTSLQGDMYGPVAGQTFDRIAAHPPFVPSSGNRVIYRDGGADGEELLRRVVVEGVPRLAEQGILYASCIASDRKSGRMEERIRQLIAPLGLDADVLLLTRFEMDALEYRVQLLRRHHKPLAELDSHREYLDHFGIERMVGCSLYLRRRTGGVPVTRRRVASGVTTPAAALWQLAIEAALSDAATAASLGNRTARATPGVALEIRYAGQPEGWLPSTAGLSTDWPFGAVVRAPVWLADLVNRLDGTVRLGEVLASLRASGQIGAEATDSALGELLIRLVATGILTVDGLPAPPPLPQVKATEDVA